MSLPVASESMWGCLTSDLSCCVSRLRKEVEKCHGRRESFLEVARNVLQDRITLDRIAVLVYLAGRLQVRVGPQLVPLVPVLVNLVGPR